MQQPLVRTICTSCRLRQIILTHQLQRSGISRLARRDFHVSPRASVRQRRSKSSEKLQAVHLPIDVSIEDTVLHARKVYGDRLPDGLLSPEQGKVYERLYGRPLKTVKELDDNHSRRSSRSRRSAIRIEAPSHTGWDEVADASPGTQDGNHGSHEVQAVLNDHQCLEEDVDDATGFEDVDQDDESAESGERVHLLTKMNKFGTSPSTIFLPKDSLVDPIDALTKRTPANTLTESAHRVFGGKGLPYSASTPALGKTMQQKAISLDVSQGRMTEMDGDVFAAVLMPAMYASITSVLVETRKRLGTRWAESLVRKAEQGTLQILDAGGAGMGVLAVRDLLRAEWERMKEEGQDQGRPLAVALADGKSGGASASPPLGKATVWISSDVLRERASTLLRDTAFIPRMPDYVHTETARYSGKFDIIIAAHTLWPIREDWERRLHVENLWSLLRAESGVLCLLEKGIARGFEAIAAARRFLLRNRIAEPDTKQISVKVSEQGDWEPVTTYEKERGMIIAPCTNHEECPMYHGDLAGTIKGRSSICHFKQRYIRPPFLQRILRARDKNHEDVDFSYLSVIRGTDFRSKHQQPLQDTAQAIQGDEASNRAAQGFSTWPQPPSEEHMAPSSLSLPRVVMPTMKRHGHVIIDLCTPSGKLERWTVPRSFSKQAFHDARKSRWGDLWAMGAKTRVAREAKLGKHARIVQQPKPELTKKAVNAKRKLQKKKPYQKHMQIAMEE